MEENKARLPTGLSFDTQPMEAKLALEVPTGRGWLYEPKWDGFRCLAFKIGSVVELRAKSGKSLTRYFPEIVEIFRKLRQRRIVIDGELVVPIRGVPSFEALQMRLHPAKSRIRKLSAETPAKLIMFDLLLAPSGKLLLDVPLSARRKFLEAFARGSGTKAGLELSPATPDVRRAKRWLKAAGRKTDGIIAKRSDEPYQAGERAMVKVKPLRTADCVVGGFRYESGSKEVGSLLLGLYDKSGKLNHIGFTATISDKERPALTKRLEKLRKSPGFTGKAPGGPSRWSTKRTSEWQPLKPQLVAEVRFDHVSGGRFRHGTKLVRWRPDKKAAQCRMEQIGVDA